MEAQLAMDGMGAAVSKGRAACANVANRPWPVQALLERRGIDLPLLAELVGVDHTTAWRRLEWGLTTDESDEWAIALGLHPCDVWGWEWCEDALNQPEQGDLFGSVFDD